MKTKKAITLALVIVLLALMAACENSLDTPYEKNKTAALITVNPETMTVEKTLKVSENFEATDASLKGESIVIRLSDRTIIVDKSLSRYEDIKLPDVIAEKINRETKYNEKGCPRSDYYEVTVSPTDGRYIHICFYGDEYISVYKGEGFEYYKLVDGKTDLNYLKEFFDSLEDLEKPVGRPVIKPRNPALDFVQGMREDMDSDGILEEITL